MYYSAFINTFSLHNASPTINLASLFVYHDIYNHLMFLLTKVCRHGGIPFTQEKVLPWYLSCLWWAEDTRDWARQRPCLWPMAGAHDNDASKYCFLLGASFLELCYSRRDRWKLAVVGLGACAPMMNLLLWRQSCAGVNRVVKMTCDGRSGCGVPPWRKTCISLRRSSPSDSQLLCGQRVWTTVWLFLVWLHVTIVLRVFSVVVDGKVGVACS